MKIIENKALFEQQKNTGQVEQAALPPIFFASATNTNFSGANLSNSMLESLDFSGASFTGADFTSTSIEQCLFTGADFTEANIDNCGFKQSVLDKGNFDKTTINSSEFSDCSLFGTTFKGAKLVDTLLRLILPPPQIFLAQSYAVLRQAIWTYAVPDN